MSLINRIRDWKPFGGSKATEAAGDGSNATVVAQLAKGWTPTQEGWLNTGWDPGWWQQNLQPLNVQGINSTVEACISALAQTSAMCPIHLMDEDKEGTKTRRWGSSPERVMHSPNDYETRTLFMANMARSVYYEGNAYAVAERDDRGAISKLHLLDPKSTRAIADPESGEVFYYGSAKQNQPTDFDFVNDRVYPARNVFHLRLHTDRDPLKGVTPITAAANAITANSAIMGHQATFFTRMTRPSGVLSTEQVLNKDQMNTLREAFKEQSVEMDSGGIPVLGGGLKFQQMSLSNEDTELAETFGMTVADISRAFRVPLPVINDMTGSTFNNADTLMNWFLASGLGFLIESAELEFGRLFSLPFGRKFELDTKVLMRVDWKTRIETLGEGVTKGIYSPDEGRSRAEGLPPVPNGAGAVPRVQQQMIPLDAPVAPEPTDGDELEAELREEFVTEKAIV